MFGIPNDEESIHGAPTPRQITQHLFW